VNQVMNPWIQGEISRAYYDGVLDARIGKPKKSRGWRHMAAYTRGYDDEMAERMGQYTRVNNPRRPKKKSSGQQTYGAEILVFIAIAIGALVWIRTRPAPDPPLELGVEC